MTEDVKLPDIEVELPKLPPMGYGNEGYSVQAMHEYAVEYAYKFARLAVLQERERCATLCDAEHFGGQRDDDLSWTTCAAHLAAAIRAGHSVTETKRD